MSKIEDLTNRRFSKLSVVQKLPKNDSFGNMQWKCKCDCGKTITTITFHLTNDVVRSCGCPVIIATDPIVKK